MKRKKLIVSILVATAVAGTAFYLLATESGKKEWKRLKKTGSVTADTFTNLGKEISRNNRQARKEERTNALKAFAKEMWEAEV